MRLNKNLNSLRFYFLFIFLFWSSFVFFETTESTPAVRIREADPIQKKNEIYHLEVNAPRKKKVEEEVVRNPHFLPESLLIFASKLGQDMEYAQRNSGRVPELILKLKECILDAEAQLSARALCLAQMHRLVEFSGLEVVAVEQKMNWKVPDQVSQRLRNTR